MKQYTVSDHFMSDNKMKVLLTLFMFAFNHTKLLLLLKSGPHTSISSTVHIRKHTSFYTHGIVRQNSIISNYQKLYVL